MRLAVAAVGGMIVLAACSTDPAASSDVTLAVAAVAGEGAAHDVEVMHGPGGHFGIGLWPEVRHLRCDVPQHHGIAVVRTCIYKDASGAVQTAYDSLTTESVAVHTEISDSVVRDQLSGFMNRTTDVLVTGLAGTETTRTWNGTSSGSSQRIRMTDSSGTVQFDMTESSSIENVVIPVPKTDSSWPLSGKITKHVVATFTGGARDGETVDRTAVIEFNGTQYATVTVDGETFDFDLARRGRPDRHGGHGRP
ncbi:MAG: hypothetical protein R2882_03055 [Gemmatimonadales bacterium]